MKKILIAFVVLLAIALAGCVSEKQTYQHEKYPWNITLNPDGTYIMYDGDPILEYTGNYRVDGNSVKIERAFGMVYSLRIVDNKLVDSNNNSWIKV